MSFTLELPNEYGLVLAVASSSFFVTFFHMVLTGKARKASGLKYPISYATEEQAAKDKNAFAFNCAQRAHANFTETHVSFLGGLLISGLQYPTASAVLGATWVLGRVFYALGYTGSGPSGRLLGFYPSLLADFSLRSMALYTSIKYAMGQ